MCYIKIAMKNGIEQSFKLCQTRCFILHCLDHHQTQGQLSHTWPTHGLMGGEQEKKEKMGGT